MTVCFSKYADDNSVRKKSVKFHQRHMHMHMPLTHMPYYWSYWLGACSVYYVAMV